MKQTFKYWIYARCSSATNQISFEISDLEWTGRHLEGRVLIREYEVEHEMPDIKDITPEIVKGLEAMREGIRAEMSVEIMTVDNRIQSLLAIEQVQA